MQTALFISEPDPPADPQPWDGPCKACGGGHHIQDCPAITDALPNPGRAIARQWSCDTRRFADVLRGLDPSVWHLLAAPCALYRGMTTADVLDRWGRLVRGVELPRRAA